MSTRQTKPGGKMFSYVPGMMDIHVMPASADMAQLDTHYYQKCLIIILLVHL
jgi:hypothetical protein